MSEYLHRRRHNNEATIQLFLDRAENDKTLSLSKNGRDIFPAALEGCESCQADALAKRDTFPGTIAKSHHSVNGITAKDICGELGLNVVEPPAGSRAAPHTAEPLLPDRS